MKEFLKKNWKWILAVAIILVLIFLYLKFRKKADRIETAKTKPNRHAVVANLGIVTMPAPTTPAPTGPTGVIANTQFGPGQ